MPKLSRLEKKLSEESKECFLIGRDNDLRVIRNKVLVNTGKLTTIKGAPGIGKTAIALALMDKLRLSFKNGCVFISLEGVDTKDSLVVLINSTLGVSSDTKEAPLFSFLQEKEILLILDNFEDPLHDRTAVIDFMHRLINNKGNARILVTSREELADASLETIYPIDKLDRKDSRTILYKLALGQDCPEETLTEGMEELLAELDDVPLALVLAAPYLKHGIKSLVEDLETNGLKALRVLGIDDQAAGKEQSIIKSFYLSYRTIEEKGAAQLFQVCSLFPAGLTETDARAILPGIIRPDFMTLVSKSLLQITNSRRYSLLAPLRRYAEKLLFRNNQNKPIFDKWIVLIMKKTKLYDDTVKGHRSADVSSLIYEFPNILRAIEYLISLGVQGKDRLLKIMTNMAVFMRFRGIHRDAEHYFTVAGQIAKTADDIKGEANCIQSLGDIYFRESRNAEALKSFEAALLLYRRMRDVLGEANCIQSLGDIYFRESRNAEAHKSFEAALLLYRRVGDVLGEANCIQSFGDIYFRESRNAEARKSFEAALPLYRQVGDVLGEANCIQSLGDIHFRESRNAEARKSFKAALLLYRQVGDVLGEANCIQSLGDIYFRELRNAEARKSFEAALPRYRQLGDFFGEANCTKRLGDIYFRESRNAEARKSFGAALLLYRQVGDVLGEANCIRSLGDIYFRESGNAEARKSFEAALPLYHQVGDVLGEANCTKMMGKVLIDEDFLLKGRLKFTEAKEMYNRINDRYSLGICLFELAIALKKRGQHIDEIKGLLNEAAEIFDTIEMPVLVNRCKEMMRS